MQMDLFKQISLIIKSETVSILRDSIFCSHFKEALTEAWKPETVILKCLSLEVDNRIPIINEWSASVFNQHRENCTEIKQQFF